MRTRSIVGALLVAGVMQLTAGSTARAADTYTITAGGHAIFYSPMDQLMQTQHCSADATGSALNGIGERVIPAGAYAGHRILVRASAAAAVPLGPAVAKFSVYTQGCVFGVPRMTLSGSDGWIVDMPLGAQWMNVIASAAVSVTFTVTIL